MAEHPRNILICSCEDTIPLDAEAVKRGCRGATVSTAQQLCRAELDKFRAAAASDAPLTIGCANVLASDRRRARRRRLRQYS